MGMAASQARFLGLTARKTNVEYEGQQVNQQRTALATQSANLLNNLLTLDVPTPPLATNYSKTEYVFVDPATSQQINLDSIYKNPLAADGTESWTVSGYSKISAVRSSGNHIYPTSAETENNSQRFIIDMVDGKPVISVNGGTNMSVTGPAMNNALIPTFNEADKELDNDTTVNPNEYFYKFTNPQTKIEYYIPAGKYEQKTQDAIVRDSEGKPVLIDGKEQPIYEKDADGNDTTVRAKEPVYKMDADGKYALDAKGNKQPVWDKEPLTLEQIETKAKEDGKLYLYSAEGYTKSEEFSDSNAVLREAGDGTGRYGSISFYRKSQIDQATGEIKPGEKPTIVKLTQQTVQDETAFNDAMDTYNAKKTIYDKTISDINAKTSIIQQQDKTLELHLDQLDTEQQAVQTEMDAVKKVIDKNIEETFKTFA